MHIVQEQDPYGVAQRRRKRFKRGLYRSVVGYW